MEQEPKIEAEIDASIKQDREARERAVAAQEPKIEKSELSLKIERLRNALKKWEESPDSVPERYKEKIEEILNELESEQV